MSMGRYAVRMCTYISCDVYVYMMCIWCMCMYIWNECGSFRCLHVKMQCKDAKMQCIEWFHVILCYIVDTSLPFTRTSLGHWAAGAKEFDCTFSATILIQCWQQWHTDVVLKRTETNWGLVWPRSRLRQMSATNVCDKCQRSVRSSAPWASSPLCSVLVQCPASPAQ